MILLTVSQHRAGLPRKNAANTGFGEGEGSALIYIGNKGSAYKIIMSVWIHCQKRETNHIYSVLCSPSGNTELTEHELLKPKLSKSHQYSYRKTPTSVKKLLAFQAPIFHNLSPSGWETLCLHWRLSYFSKAASCLSVCKWKDVLKFTALFAGSCSLAANGHIPWFQLTQQAETW